jgi:hypothetical protein
LPCVCAGGGTVPGKRTGVAWDGKGRMRPASLLCTGLVVLGALAVLAAPSAQIQGQQTSVADGALVVEYFYSPTCLQCRRASPALEAAQTRFGQRVRVVRHDITQLNDLEQMLALEAKCGVEAGVPPQVFIAGHCLRGADDILARLETVIQQELDRKAAPASAPATTSAPAPSRAVEPPEAQAPAIETAIDAFAAAPRLVSHPAGVSPPAGDSRVRGRFQSLRISTIALAGLADGVNPCAFTTIVFLLSAMGYLGRSRRQILLVGLSFTFAVFVTYLLLGIGLMAAVKHFSVRSGVSQVVTYAVAAVALGLAGWSFFDGVRTLRSGKVPRAALGLPKSIKAAIHWVIRVGLRSPYLVLGSLVVGFLVSLLESFCTGQVYVPTILVMVRAGGPGRARALGLLVFYNIMFILPLAAIMVAAYCGVGSQRLGQILRDHLAAFKFAMAALFAGLAAVLLVL